jgi:hypothetical protein
MPGIYNPPYAKKPTAFGLEVEAQLKAIFKVGSRHPRRSTSGHRQVREAIARFKEKE